MVCRAPVETAKGRQITVAAEKGPGEGCTQPWVLRSYSWASHKSVALTVVRISWLLCQLGLVLGAVAGRMHVNLTVALTPTGMVRVTLTAAGTSQLLPQQCWSWETLMLEQGVFLRKNTSRSHPKVGDTLGALTCLPSASPLPCCSQACVS